MKARLLPRADIVVSFYTASRENYGQLNNWAGLILVISQAEYCYSRTCQQSHLLRVEAVSASILSNNIWTPIGGYSSIASSASQGSREKNKWLRNQIP